MSKQTIANAIKEQFDFTGVASRQVVDAMVDNMAGILMTEGRLGIPGFGTFMVRATPARRAINPRTGEKVAVPAGHTVRFRPSPLLRDKVSKVQGRKRKSAPKAAAKSAGKPKAKTAGKS